MKFFLGKSAKRKIGKIYIKRSYSNIFVTLTDLNNQVIICKTSGMCDDIPNRRRKRMPQAIEKIVYHLKDYFKKYKITHIHLILKMRVKAHVYTLIYKLKTYGIKILSIISRRLIAHNGVKGRNLRRL